jgi:addiction module HigA family antidote
MEMLNMDKIHYTPVHPGEVLRDELEEVGLTQSALAKHIGVLPKTINEICQKKRGISADMAMKLAKALGGSPRFWFNLQNNWEISLLKKTDFKEIKPLAA